MRGLPSFSLAAPRALGWRVAVCALALAAGAAAVAWIAALVRGGAAGAAAAAGLGAVAALLLALGLSAARVVPAPLRWTGRAWLWGADEDAAPARVRLAVDLGSWVLLHAATGAAPRRAAWLPLSAREFTPAAWHALRCALHAGAPRDG